MSDDSNISADGRFELNRRRLLQSQTAGLLGIGVLDAAVGDAEASTRNAVTLHGPSETTVGSSETYRASVGALLDEPRFDWYSSGTISGSGHSVSITFDSPGDHSVSVAVSDGDLLLGGENMTVFVRADDGGGEPVEPDPVDVSIVGPDEVAVGQTWSFEADPEEAADISYDWSVEPSGAGDVVSGADERDAEIEFAADGDVTVHLDYETDEGYEGHVSEDFDVVQIELAIEDTRLVQTVENTRVEDPSRNDLVVHDEPDPALVADRRVAAAFTLESTTAEYLRSPVAFVVERTVTNPVHGTTLTRTEEFEMTTSEVEEMVTSDEGVDVLADIADSTPVFTFHPGRWITTSVTVRVDESHVESTARTIHRDDVETAGSQTLRVGFAHVRDPENGTNYGSVDDGAVSNFAHAVREAVDFLERNYPVDRVVAYRLDDPIRGSNYFHRGADRRLAIAGDHWVDAETARSTLDDELPIEDPSETVDGNGTIPETLGFDETVLVVPSGYFSYHRGERYCGIHMSGGDSQPQYASLVEETCVEESTAHELAHHFTQRLYEDENSPTDPMAQRRNYDGTYWDSDYAHARHQDSDNGDRGQGVRDSPGVLLTRVDLQDGTLDVELDEPSLMSYESGDRWIDARLYDTLAGDGLDPTPPETEEGTDGDEMTDVVSGIATVDDDETVSVTSIDRRRGKPMASESDGDVTVTVDTLGGDTFDTLSTNDEWTVQHDGHRETVSGVVPFVLRYADDVDTIRIEREGTTTVVDPIARLLDDAANRLASQSFVTNPGDRRGALDGKLSAVAKQIETGAYRGALKKLQNDVRERADDWLRGGVSVPPTCYTKAEFVELIDDAIAKVGRLMETDERDDRRGRGNGEKKGHDEENPGKKKGHDEDGHEGKKKGHDEENPGKKKGHDGGDDSDEDDGSDDEDGGRGTGNGDGTGDSAGGSNGSGRNGGNNGRNGDTENGNDDRGNGSNRGSNGGKP